MASKPYIVFCDQTICRSLFHSLGVDIAKPCLPMAFLGRTEERESQFPRVRLLVMIKDDKYVGWENLNAYEIFEMVVAGTTNLGYMTGKGVSRIKSNT